MQNLETSQMEDGGWKVEDKKIRLRSGPRWRPPKISRKRNPKTEKSDD